MYEYEIENIEVYDGDTIKADIDLGFYTWIKKRSIRINGIDTPEKKLSKKRLAIEKEAGLLITKYVKELIAEADYIWIKSKELDKYGRVLADVYLEKHQEIIESYSLGARLVELGFSKKYDGGKKEKWKVKELKEIIKKLNV